MADYTKPTEDLPIFDSTLFLESNVPITQKQADKRYLRYPNAQGTENLQTTNVNGLLTANGNIKTNIISAIATILDIGKSRMLGQLDINSNALNRVRDIFGNDTNPLRFLVNNIQDIQFILDAIPICTINALGLNMNNTIIYDINILSGLTNQNFSINALGTGYLQLFSNSINRLTFRDTGECLANSNGLYIQGLTNSNSQLRFGYNSSIITQGIGSVSIGGGSGTVQGTNSIAIGQLSGTSQGNNSISMGNQAGLISQINSCVAIGTNAGRTQGSTSIAIGNNAGTTLQGLNCIAIGNAAGRTQSNNAISIGLNSGTTGTQGFDTVAIGNNAGSNAQGDSSISIGLNSASTAQGVGSVAIGQSAGQNQGLQCVAIGYFAGKGDVTKTGDNAIAIGQSAGQISQGIDSIAIGDNAGNSSQKRECIAIGLLAGNLNQGNGYISNFDASIAIGHSAGQSNQTRTAIAIGSRAGNSSQALSAIAIGYNAGQTNQSTQSICIGSNSGASGAGSNSIYIGNLSGSTTTLANSILLNASGVVLNPTVNQGFYVNPIRPVITGLLALSYDATTKEVVYLSSSQRYKKNIEDLNIDTSVFHKMRPRTFNSKCETDCQLAYGFIAEELEEISPLLVYHNEEGLPESILWDRINLFSICEIQKLRKDNDELKDIVNLLIEEINILKTKII